MFHVDVKTHDNQFKHYEYYERPDALIVFNKEVADVNTAHVLLLDAGTGNEFPRTVATYKDGSTRTIAFPSNYDVELYPAKKNK